MKDLSALPKLDTLDLVGTDATDDHVKDLAPVRTLTHLDLIGSQVTDAGVKELQKALPKCKIVK